LSAITVIVVAVIVWPTRRPEISTSAPGWRLPLIWVAASIITVRPATCQVLGWLWAVAIPSNWTAA
jgi:hypothetical protein